MATNPNIQHLKTARDKLVDVYSSEAKDNLHDNGNLTVLNNGILAVEKLIEALEAREAQP